MRKIFKDYYIVIPAYLFFPPSFRLLTTICLIFLVSGSCARNSGLDSGDPPGEAPPSTASPTISDVDEDNETDSERADPPETDTGTGTDTPDGLDAIELTDVEYVLDPYDAVPLAAVVTAAHEELHAEEVREIRLTLEGTGDDAPLATTLYPDTEAYRTNFDMDDIIDDDEVGVPVLGLHHGEDNLVRFDLVTDTRRFSGEVIIPVPLLDSLEEERVTIDIFDAEAMEPGWTGVNSRIYDREGRCRWMGLQVHHILQNGNFLDISKVDEFNLLGRKVTDRTDLLPENLVTHHDSVVLPNGNIIVCVNDAATDIVNGEGEEVASVEDALVEMDGTTGDIVNAWDLREFFDVDRYTLTDDNEDWFHLNTVAYDPLDDTILVSGRYQGVAKLTRRGTQGEEPNQGKELEWIIAPHLDWGTAGWDGRGDIDPSLYLLTAVDANGVPYEEAVQLNLAPPPPGSDPFHWPIGQHGLRITSRQEDKLTFLTFNNQASVIFDGEGTIDNQLNGDLSNDRASEPYSLLTEYEVDEVARTVRQIWSYGQNQPEYFCSYRSGIKQMPQTGNRLMFSCGVDRRFAEENPFNPHVVELDEAGNVIFHLEIENTDLGLYRSARIDLYHPETSAEDTWE